VIAEYRASSADPNVADDAETVLLVIPQPVDPEVLHEYAVERRLRRRPLVAPDSAGLHQQEAVGLRAPRRRVGF